jgi:hypothetical protein
MQAIRDDLGLDTEQLDRMLRIAQSENDATADAVGASQIAPVEAGGVSKIDTESRREGDGTGFEDGRTLAREAMGMDDQQHADRPRPSLHTQDGDVACSEIGASAGVSAPDAAEQMPANVAAALDVLDGIAAKNLDNGQVYVIRFDRKRLAQAGTDAEHSALRALEIYGQALKMRAGNKWRHKVKLVGFDGIPCLGDKLISVDKYADISASKPIGSAQIDIDGLLNDTAFDVVTALNMAMTACEIPVGTSAESAKRDHRSVFDRIVAYYNMLNSEPFNIEKVSLDIIKLTLPSISKLSGEALRDYYRLTLEALRKYA